MDEILTHNWEGQKLKLLVQWNLGDTTWEPVEECDKLAALDRYLELLGIKDKKWQSLPHRESSQSSTSRGRVKQSREKAAGAKARKSRIGVS